MCQSASRENGGIAVVQQTIVWAAVCVGILGLCLWRPSAGRVAIGVFFILMAVGVNIVLAVTAPDSFVKLGTDAPLIPLYRWVFENVVAAAPVAVGAVVASYEIGVGVLLLLGGRWTKWGLIAGTVFVLLITPLGPWTLPNVIMAAAMLYLLRREDLRHGVLTMDADAA